MRSTQSNTKFLLLSIVISMALLSAPSEAFSFRKFFFRIVNAVSSVVNRVANVATDCKNSNVHGIRTECFDTNGNNKIRASMDSLMAHPRMLKFKNMNVSAYQLTKHRTKAIANYQSRQIRIIYPYSNGSCSNSGTNLGCNNGGTTFISEGGANLSPLRGGAFLLHESEHSTGQSHNCGKADKSTAGPYGLEAFYLMSLYHYGTNLTMGEREQAKASASSLATYKFCGSTVARDEVLNYK